MLQTGAESLKAETKASVPSLNISKNQTPSGDVLLAWLESMTLKSKFIETSAPL